MKSKEEKLVIALGNGKSLVCEKMKNEYIFPDEFSLYIADAEGLPLQNICLVRPNLVSQKDEWMINQDKVDVLVWADENDEDYTDEFVINHYQEEV